MILVQPAEVNEVCKRLNAKFTDVKGCRTHGRKKPLHRTSSSRMRTRRGKKSKRDASLVSGALLRKPRVTCVATGYQEVNYQLALPRK